MRRDAPSIRRPARLMLLAVAVFGVALSARAQDPAAGLERVAEGLVHPVVLAEAPDGSGRLFVADQTGQIWIVLPDGTRRDTPFLDLSARMVALNSAYDERGLLGLAFHPEYATNGRFFVYYSAPLRPDAPGVFDHTSHLSAFTVSADPDVADSTSEEILLQVDQPQSNHNAGTLAFGPEDGYLYVSLGDGGGRDDEGTGHVDDWYDFNAGGNGQDVTQNLLGSILRIDVDNPSGGLPYGIPPDNPFVGQDGLDEQYAYGFRNPYRFSFDRGGDHLLLAGDAGQDLWEEVSAVTAGGNYGWNVKEGTHCFDAANPQDPPATCPETDAEGDPLIDPVVEFANAQQEGGLGQVVVGGHVYRGPALPGLDGQYLFGVWSRGTDDAGQTLPGGVFVATPQDEGLWPFEALRIAGQPDEQLDAFLLSFGEDLDGDVYLLTTHEVGPTGNTGEVYRLVDPGLVESVEDEAALPRLLRLEQNYPNPFNPQTSIRFHLAAPAEVSVVVHDLTGRVVRRLLAQPMAPGRHTVVWDGRTDAGRAAASGVYLYRVSAGTAEAARLMTLLR